MTNARFEGILVANATDVTISGNTVYGNNTGLVTGSTTTCPGLPAFETNEDTDCGEGIHLIAVDHSVISGNTVQNNSGGIIVTDETGPNYRNVISGNTVTDNALACGITLASHCRAPNLPAGANYGVFANTISNNVASHNGYIAQGSGVGIYAAGPGATAAGNDVTGNILRDNGGGGVAMHNHAAPGVAGVPAQAPPVNLSDNTISNNQISGNGTDVDDPLSPGPTGISIFSFAPISGTVISQNTFNSEVADIVFNAPVGIIAAHLNSFSADSIGVDAESIAGIDASQNWWGCPTGPSGVACATIKGFVPAPPSTKPRATSAVSAVPEQARLTFATVSSSEH